MTVPAQIGATDHGPRDAAHDRARRAGNHGSGARANRCTGERIRLRGKWQRQGSYGNGG